MEKFVYLNYWTHNFSFPTCVRRHWSSSYRVSLSEQSFYMSGDFYSYHVLAGVMAYLVLQKYESLCICYTDMPKGLLKLLSHCIMLVLPSSHAAELLQVAWKSLICVGILARIWVLAISGARTQIRVLCGTESYQVSAQACIILYICGQKEAFSSTQLTRHIGDMFYNSSWYLSSHGEPAFLPKFTELPSLSVAGHRHCFCHLLLSSFTVWKLEVLVIPAWC